MKKIKALIKSIFDFGRYSYFEIIQDDGVTYAVKVKKKYEQNYLFIRDCFGCQHSKINSYKFYNY